MREYDNLFSDAQPDAAEDFLTCLNPDSLHVLTGCKVESALVEEAKKFDAVENREGKNAPAFQFMRLGYFCLDNQDCHGRPSGLQPQRRPEGQLQKINVSGNSAPPSGGALLLFLQFFTAIGAEFGKRRAGTSSTVRTSTDEAHQHPIDRQTN